MRWTHRRAGRCGLGAYGEVVWYQRRRFEVPAEFAASPRQELQIESGTGILNFASALLLSEVRKEGPQQGRPSERGHSLPRRWHQVGDDVGALLVTMLRIELK